MTAKPSKTLSGGCSSLRHNFVANVVSEISSGHGSHRIWLALEIGYGSVPCWCKGVLPAEGFERMSGFTTRYYEVHADVVFSAERQ